MLQELVSKLAEDILKKRKLTGVGIAVGHRDSVDLAVHGNRRHKGDAPIAPSDKWHLSPTTACSASIK